MLTLSHLGRYEIETEIGRGAMGVVYRARDPKIDRTVANATVDSLGASEFVMEGPKELLQQLRRDHDGAARMDVAPSGSKCSR